MTRIARQSDIIIAKGQGNFEILSGSGKNIYYLFLCKCDVFIAKLKAGKLTRYSRPEYRCRRSTAVASPTEKLDPVCEIM
jgi:damage-control phosphatase, subfamily I